ncbi:ribosome maturation factor [Sphingorhabdus lutea]|uniref:Ribosome maturation factor RimP n=1 Tax=Sphingorhabdus lutea TaxID=1913578 RepID=A0A1L3JF22_9SPHN|nr:ribosome maturation protein RimP [Sphingorhabdus lutea]APG63738.1 ribosome maturation factor [Sphingorhabdus lutea]
MDDLQKLQDIILPEVQACGFDLVRVKWIGSGEDRILQIMAERPDTRQLNIDDCGKLSRLISDKFDELDPIEETYRLEVSSPGIDRPLTRLSDFSDWAGHDVRLVPIDAIDGHRQFRGAIVGVDNDIISVDDRKFGVCDIPFNMVKSAKLLLTDRLIASTAPMSASGVDDVETETAVDDGAEYEQED